MSPRPLRPLPKQINSNYLHKRPHPTSHSRRVAERLTDTPTGERKASTAVLDCTTVIWSELATARRQFYFQFDAGQVDPSKGNVTACRSFSFVLKSLG